jgi:hypothetical protein
MWFSNTSSPELASQARQAIDIQDFEFESCAATIFALLVLVQVAIVGPPRPAAMAHAKYSAWVQDRKHIENMKPKEAAEVQGIAIADLEHVA